MANYLHVVGAFKTNPERFELLGRDLSQRDLYKTFVSPYEAAARVKVGPNVFDLGQLTSVTIVETSLPMEAALAELAKTSSEEIRRLNAENSGVVFVLPGYGWESTDIVHTGHDVTDTYITGAPGSGGKLKSISTLMNNNWVVTIGAGLILLIVAALFG